MPAKSPFLFDKLEELNPITEKIIGCVYRVSNSLGVGFIEKVYENALVHELRKAGLKVQQQYPIRVYYDGVVVGDFVADLIVESVILLELKAVTEIDRHTPAKCMNYLRATGLPLCLLVNFGTPKAGIQRIAKPFGRKNLSNTDKNR